MRQFVAACCCAIVGLEVLTAVPLVTCLVVLGLIGDVGGNQIAATVPPPQYASVPMMLPSPVAPLLPSPVCDQSAICSAPVCTAPSICTAPPAPSADTKYPVVPVAPPAPGTPPAQLTPQVAVISDMFEQVGSPLAASSLAGDSGATLMELIAALNRVAKEDATEPIANLKPDPAPANQTPAAAEEAAPEARPKSPATTCPEHHAARPALVDSLQVAVELLYGRAQALEIDCNFDRADHLRRLARDLRLEIEVLRNESNSAAPAPGAVTAASYDAPLLEEPAKLDADHAAVSPAPAARPLSPSPSSLQPARAKLVEPPGNPQPLNVVASEEELPEAQKVPENPAP